MAETTDEQVKAPEVVENVKADETPAAPEAETQTEAPAAEEPQEDKPKAKRTRAKKQVNLDKDMDKVHPTFATGIQAVMRDLIKNKGKK